jgi:hypothetical protein
MLVVHPLMLVVHHLMLEVHLLMHEVHPLMPGVDTINHAGASHLIEGQVDMMQELVLVVDMANRITLIVVAPLLSLNLQGLMAILIGMLLLLVVLVAEKIVMVVVVMIEEVMNQNRNELLMKVQAKVVMINMLVVHLK